MGVKKENGKLVRKDGSGVAVCSGEDGTNGNSGNKRFCPRGGVEAWLEEIGFLALPSVLLSEKCSLPQLPCIYFVLDTLETVHYVGRSVNTKNRWKIHHKYAEFTKIPNAKIAYMEVSDPALLPDIEKALIEWFNPSLNGARYDVRPRSRGVSRLYAHLVLTTKFRLKVIPPAMLQRLQAIMADLCTKWQCELLECNGEADHLHLVFRYAPQLQLSKFIDNVKSVSSRRVRQEFEVQLREAYWD